MGCPLSIGDHLFIDYERENWKEVFMHFLDQIWKDQERFGANTLNLRDFRSENEKVQQFLSDQGFIKAQMLDNHVISNIENFEKPEDYLSQLKSGNKRYVRQRAIAYSHHYEIQYIDKNNIELDFDRVYELYKNVKDKSFDLNVFSYSKKIFEAAYDNPNWEFVTLSLNADTTNDSHAKPIAMALSYKTEHSYNFLIAGLDYAYLESHELYSQLLWQIVLRANELGYQRIDLGLTTAQNKRKFGASSVKHNFFVQMKDNFNASIVASFVENH